MKKAAILFAVFFVISLCVPMFAAFSKKQESTDEKEKNELVTIFSGKIDTPYEFSPENR